MARTYALFCVLALASHAGASGIVLPSDSGVMPLALVSQNIRANLDGQAGVVSVEQVFRNHTSRPQEAVYIFPVPRDASVDGLSMWVDGKEMTGELLDAKQASKIYLDIVRRYRDPALLEYIGQDLLKVRVFPVPARGDAKIRVRYRFLAQSEQGVVRFTFPQRTDGRSTRTLEEFSLRLEIKSPAPIASVYSPTHAISVQRPGSREAIVEFSKLQSMLDRDFLLYYTTSDQPVGLSVMGYRPVSSEDGFALLLMNPNIEMEKRQRSPQDFVFVLDTSGSMSEAKMAQARDALKLFLGRLHADDRFAMINFASSVNTFDEDLAKPSRDMLERATKWIDDLRAGGGTAILPALLRSLEFRPKDGSRPFSVVFFTDGMPTVDETDPVKIVRAIEDKNSMNTRIFAFGVGDDVNASMLDHLAESTRAASLYVRPSEHIEEMASLLHEKISQPALTNVRIAASGVKLHEIYPIRLPDLFHGGQLVVLARYSGQGRATIRLQGRQNEAEREFIYEVEFPERTDSGRDFIEHLWARRKVGFLLGQIRLNGESKELVDEVKRLAKKYGIATPYTSYLVVPDLPIPVAAHGRAEFEELRAKLQAASLDRNNIAIGNPSDIIGNAERAGAVSARLEEFDKQLADALRPGGPPPGAAGVAFAKARRDMETQSTAGQNFARGGLVANQSGTLGVDLSLAEQQLRGQQKLVLSANRIVLGRNCIDVRGIWIDEEYDKNTPRLQVKAQSDAYFLLLERQPQLAELFVLGNHLNWIAPNGTALIIDPNSGRDTITDKEVDALFKR